MIGFTRILHPICIAAWYISVYHIDVVHSMCTYLFGQFRPLTCKPTCGCCSASDVMTRMTHLRLVLVRRSFGPSKTIKSSKSETPDLSDLCLDHEREVDFLFFLLVAEFRAQKS